MGRPPLPVGTYGKIRAWSTSTGWIARTKFRDADGVTRPVERTGSSKAAAIRNLKTALRDRSGPAADGGISPDARFLDVATLWHERIQKAADSGSRSLSTADQYRWSLDRDVLPAVGALRVRELTVPRVEAFLSAIQRNKGTSSAKMCRAVVSGVLGLAVRHGALPSNPVRDVSRLEGGRRPMPRALSAEERAEWLTRLEADEFAVQRDLPDLTRFMLATGVRLGEALAVHWPDVDLEAGVVQVEHTVIRVKGRGLVRKRTKSAAGERVLPLPSWVVSMLRRRYAASADPAGPVFPNSVGNMREASNTARDFRKARDAAGFSWVTSHVFRKTAATFLDEAGLTARTVADQLGHSRPSMTQDVYFGRRAVNPAAAAALEGIVVSEPGDIEGVKGGDDLDDSPTQAPDQQ